ncbi:DNA cytosine methyltransferase [Salinicola tamaricis]|uniref:DNA cytosine methyltransferase n=1 Tax=Salinicola tamaricis TaxID=1771309 RepID=UPI001A917144|nr:DNA cytosine methyltransferase [Salinicola tamaricis]
MHVEWETESTYARRLRGLERDPEDFGYTRIHDLGLLSSSLRTEHHRAFPEPLYRNGARENRARQSFSQAGSRRALQHAARRYGQCPWRLHSPRPIHPNLPRVITVREAARLHSYPDWFRLHSTKWHGFRQIGNSVPPLLGRAVAGSIMQALGEKPKKPRKKLELNDAEFLYMDMGEAARYFGVPHNTIAQRTRKTTSTPKKVVRDKADVG